MILKKKMSYNISLKTYHLKIVYINNTFIKIRVYTFNINNIIIYYLLINL